MFATISFERDPLQLTDVPAGLLAWVQGAGGFAAFFLLLWLVFGLVARRRLDWLGQPAEEHPVLYRLFQLTFLGAGICYAAYIVVKSPELVDWLKSYALAQAPERAATPLVGQLWLGWCLTIGGVLALFALLLQPLSDIIPFFIEIISHLVRCAGLLVQAAFLFCTLKFPAARIKFTEALDTLVGPSGRRIGAIARVTIKEAVRRRVLWVFLLILLVFLFANWFIDYKPENQVRSYVTVVYWAMTPMLLLTAGLLAALSIPNDIKNQTIYTIVTKPVERFEILIGRFLGYTLLMTVVMLAMTAVSFLYLTRELHPKARVESARARVPIYGELGFFQGNEPGREVRRRDNKGENVGREWDYRQYIEGKAAETQYAVWALHELPSEHAGRKTIPCEFQFDIYRTQKGEQVECTLTFRAWHWMPRGDAATGSTRQQQYEEERGLESTSDQDWNAFVESVLAVKYGLHRIASKPINNDHSYSVDVPTTLFRDPHSLYPEFQKEAAAAPEDYKKEVDDLKDVQDAVERKQRKEKLRGLELGYDPAARRAAFLYRQLPDLQAKNTLLDRQAKTDQAPVEVWVNSETRSQFIGMAKYDLYVLDDDRSFTLNFFKGTFGLWCRVVLVIALTLACSTCLSGIIAWIGGMVVFCLGYARDFIESVASGTSEGGGPAESFVRLIGRETVAAPLDETGTVRVALSSDYAFRWVLGCLLRLLPDVERLSFTDYVAEGFNVPWLQMGLCLLMLVGYLLPWAVLAYYLLKWREVASQ